jgi:HD-GYP domain-containing protein (c-di-GMP phosphodiesterase class II)
MVLDKSKISSNHDIDLVEQVNNQDYIKKVTELGDKIELVAGEDILTRTFHKLISQGTQIDSSFYDRLIKHKLLKPIDRSLISNEAIDSSVLVAEASHLLQNDQVLKHMFRGFPDLPYQILRNVYLENELALKLTVAKEAIPRLFQHSMMVTLVAIYLGMKAKKSNKELVALATAGLFHDIGELHLDPEIQDRSKPLDDEGWLQIYAHPFISYLILKEFNIYHPQVSTAVLDHHERLDGSGYPRNLINDDINELGHIIAVAELAAGVASGTVSKEKIEARLKLNTRKYNRSYVNFLLEVYKEISEEPSIADMLSMAVLNEKVKQLHAVVAHWHELMERLTEQQTHQELVEIINQRLSVLRGELVETGIDISSQNEMYLGMHEDYIWMNETNSVLDEAMYQIKRLVEEIKWRWPGYSEAHKARSLGQYISDWLISTKSLVQTNS